MRIRCAKSQRSTPATPVLKVVQQPVHLAPRDAGGERHVDGWAREGLGEAARAAGIHVGHVQLCVCVCWWRWRWRWRKQPLARMFGELGRALAPCQGACINPFLQRTCVGFFSPMSFEVVWYTGCCFFGSCLLGWEAGRRQRVTQLHTPHDPLQQGPPPPWQQIGMTQGHPR